MTKDIGIGREQRDKKIVSLFLSGATMQEIGDIFHLTRQRVQQIVRDKGVQSEQGGSALLAFQRRKQKEKMRRTMEKEKEKVRIADMDQWSREVLGVPLEEAFRLNGRPFRTKRRASRNQEIYQRYLAIKHQFGYKHPDEAYLNFREWCQVWKDSGHWENGPKGGYGIIRKYKNQPWSVQNARVVRLGCWMKGNCEENP
jgi:predicted DNA-binding protein YlxM (UPF0122 family)